MLKLLLVMLGGAVGSGLRYLIAGWSQHWSADPFPYGTLTVNVVGCLLIGMLGAYFASPALVREEVRLLLMVGVLGGFTTFSTFGIETFQLINDHAWGRAAANVLLSNVLGLGAAWIGYRGVEMMTS
jgi:CrcB protein